MRGDGAVRVSQLSRAFTAVSIAERTEVSFVAPGSACLRFSKVSFAVFPLLELAYSLRGCGYAKRLSLELHARFTAALCFRIACWRLIETQDVRYSL
jgi:hypothetical protein